MNRRLVAVCAALALAIGFSGHARADTAPEAPAAEHSEHGEASHGEEEPEPEFNWAYGFLGEKDGVEPSVAYRPKGMPAPFLANIINAAILFGIIVVAGKKPVVDGLKKRKERIVLGMEEAGKMKADAERQLAQYEERLKHLDSEIDRIRKDMRESAEAERQRILVEAKERRDRMERDAKLLVEQELKAAREALMHETVAAAMKSAEEIIAKEIGVADHDRLAGDYLATLQKASLGSEASSR
jgi:F-type H+-transporting ATPase subunit b